MINISVLGASTPTETFVRELPINHQWCFVLSHLRHRSGAASCSSSTYARLSGVVLCDTWNRTDDNDTVSGIAILDTTAIPEMRMRYAISMFFFQKSPYSSNHWNVCKLVCLHSDKAIACCVYCMKCAPASENITRSQAVTKIADRTSSQHFWGHVTSSVTWQFDSP